MGDVTRMKKSTSRYLLTIPLTILAIAAVTGVFFGITALGKPDQNGPGSTIFIGLAFWKLGLIAIAVLIAREKGRTPVLWGVIELFASIIGTLVLLALPHTKERKADLDGARVELPSTIEA